MELVSRNTGAIEDDYDEVLEAGFSEGIDGSGFAIFFQLDLYAETWIGDPDDTDYSSNSYCLTLGSGETCYGGLREVVMRNQKLEFLFSERIASTFCIDTQLTVTSESPEADFSRFVSTLHKIITWGTPAQIPSIADTQE